MKVQAFLISLLLLALVSNGESRSLDTNSQCATNCEAQTNFLYQPGSTYNYQYNATVQSSFFAGADVYDNQVSEVKIQANVALDILAPCEHVLRISAIGLQQKDAHDFDTSEWQRSLTQHPMHFSWQDGRVMDVCASNSDPEWVLNIKRGIVSAMQVSSPSEDNEAVVETDVTGKCASSYAIEYNGDTKTVHKSKDFNSCEEHEKLLLFSHFTPYSSDSQRQRMMLQSQTCTQTISGGILSASACSEEHLFRPFSSEENGARTIVTQNLRFNGEEPLRTVVEASQTRRTTLAFEKEPEASSREDTTEIANLLSSICDGLNYMYVYNKIGKEFVDLVFLLRRLDGPAVAQAYDSLEGNCVGNVDTLRSMFKDALKWCGSEGCVQFGTELIARGPEVLDDETSLKWLLGMNMISEPTSAMVEGLMDVLQSGRFPEQTYLTTGTIIHGICSKNENCLSLSPVRSALNFFEEKLGGNCYTPNEQRQQEILLSLRALGNAGRSNAVNTLASCAKEQRNDAETRVAAMQAFRRMPCGTDRSLESIVFDIEEDSEIRIGAYMTTMKCPTTTFMSNLVLMMDTEPSQQVASYISTHLRNLIASSDPLKGYIKPYLVEAEFAKEYNLDPRKFSQYHELSYFSEPLNAGVTAESNLVWSPKSFVPRSAGLNLTVDVFGQAVNIFEIGGRMEGVEGLLQDMMKKESFIQQTGIGKIFGKDELDVESDDNDEVEEETRKITRSASEAHVNEKKEQYQDTINKDQFGASWYIRVFGNELKYGNSRFPDVYEKINEEVSSIVMDIAKGKQVKYHDDMLLVNTANTIPTLIGLPLTLAINGSASIDVRGEGSMDLSSLLSTTPELAMNAQFYPRAAIVFSGAMTVDAHATRTGIQTESTAVMSWKVAGRAALANGRKFSLRIETPQPGETVFSFDHKLLKVVGEFTEIASPAPRDYYYEDGNQDCSSVFLGEICINKPQPEDRTVFPPSGLLSYSVYFPGSPTKVEYYQLDLSYDYVKDEQMVPSYIMGDITFDSSDPLQAHRHNFRFELERDAGVVSSTLQYPTADGTTRIDLTGEYIKMENQHSVRVTMNQDGAESQLMQTVFANNMYESIPKMSLESNWNIMGRERRINMAGAYMPSKLISFNTSLVNFLDRPIELKIGLADESSEGRQRFLVRGNALVVLPDIYENGIDFEMNVKSRPDNYAAALTYALRAEDEQSFRFVYKNVAEEDQQTRTLKFISTQFPNLNVVLTTDSRQSEGTVESSAKLCYGESALARNTESYISLTQMFSTAGSNTDRIELRADLEVLMPAMFFRKSLSWNFAIDEIEIDTGLRYNGEDYLQVTVRDRSRSVGLMSKSIKIHLPTPWQNIVLENTLQETRPNIYKLNGAIRVGHNIGMDFQTSAVLENLPTRKAFSFGISGNNAQIIAFSSHNALLEPSGFSSENTVESSYFGPAKLNLLHQGSADGSFETELLAGYATMYHYKVNLAFDNAVEKGCQLTTKIEFLDVYATMREFQVVYQHSTVEEKPSEVLRYDASIAITTNAIRGFSEAEASLLLSLQTTNSFEIRTGVTVDRSELLDAGLEYVAGEDESHKVSITFDQALGIRALPYHNIIEVKVNVAGDQKEIVLNIQDELVIDLTVRDDVRGTIQNSLFGDFPEHLDLLLTRFAQGFSARLSADRQVLNVRGRAQTDRLLVEFENTFAMLSMVPQRVVYDLSWGINNGKTGTWTTLQVNNQQATFEVFCTSARCELSFNPGTLTLDYLPVSRQTRLLGLGASVDFAPSSNLYSAELSLDDEQLFTAVLDMNALEISMKQKFTEVLPSLIKLSGTIREHHYEVALAWEETYTVLSVEGSYTLPTAEVKAMYFSNCSIIAGNYEFKFDLAPESALLSVNVDHRTLVTRATWMFGDSTDLSFDFTQNIEREVMPRLVAVKMSLVSMFEHSFDVRYNNYYIYYSESAESGEAGENTMTTRLQQNLYESYNDITTKSTIKIGQYVASGMITCNVDDMPEISFKSAITMGLPSDDLLIYKFETNQNFGDVGYLIPAEVHLEAYTPNGDRSAVTGMKAGYSFTTETQYDTEFEAKIERSATGLVLTHAHKNGLVAAVIGQEMFDYTIQLTTINMEGFSIVSSLALDRYNTYTAKIEGNGRVTSTAYEFNTNFETNVFEILDFEVVIPKQVKTTTQIGVTQGDDTISARSNFDTVITRVYTRESGEDEVLTNYINFDFGLQLFNWNFEFSGKHDLDLDFIPADFRYELLVSGSTDESPVYYKTFTLSVTTDEKKQTATFSLNRNPADKSIYAIASHNVSMLLEYGVPGNISVSFRPKSNYDFDISIVYDTSRKSIGFKFDYVSDINKVVFDFYHDLDMLTHNLNIPKKMGVEGQYQLNDRDYYAQLQTTYGEDVRSSEVTLRWDGESLADLTSITYRHQQDFTEQPYMPQKLRVKLSRSFDNAEFGARFAIDDAEVRFNLNLESTDEEYSPSLYTFQTINKAFPRRLKATGMLNTALPHVELKVKAGSKTLMELSADYTDDGHERTLTATLAQELLSAFSREAGVVATSVVNTEQMNFGLDLSSDELSFKVAFESGVDAQAKSMYLQLTHDQMEWKNLGLAMTTRFEGQLYVGDTYDITLRLLRDEVENGAAVSLSWNVARQALTVSASVSHDVSEIAVFVPNNVQGRFYGEYSAEGVLTSLNATLNEETFAHAVNLFLQPSTNGYTTGATFMHDNRYLSEASVPNSIGVKLVGEYNNGAVSGNFMFNYGQETMSTHLQAGPTPQLDVSFTIRSSAIDYDGEVRFSASTEELDMSLTLNGQRVSSVRGTFSLNDIEINLQQRFETALLPSDITFAYRKLGVSEIELNIEYVMQEKTSLTFSYRPTAAGSIVIVQISDGEVKELVSEYSLDQRSFSINLEQNIFESNVPKTSGFTATFEGDAERPQLFASLRLDETTNTLTAQADLKELSFSFEHDLPIPLLPRSMGATVGYSLDEPLSFEATVNVDDISARGSMTIHQVGEKGVDITIQHNLPVEFSSPLSLSTKYSANRTHNFGMDMQVGEFTGSAEINVDTVRGSASLTHTFAALTEYFIPRNIFVKADASSQQPITAEVLLRVDDVERSVSINLDMPNNVYTFKQMIPELSDFPQTYVLSFAGSLEPFEASAQLVMDTKTRDFSVSSNGRLALSHSIPELDAYMIPTSVDLSTDFSGSTGSVLLKYTCAGSDAELSFEYDFQPNKARLHFSETGILDMPTIVNVDLALDNKLRNVSANFVLNRNFFNLKSGLLLGDNDEGWYGMSLSVNHNINELSTIIEPSTTSTFLLKARAYEVQAVVNNGRDVDYSATGQIQVAETTGSRTVKVSYEHYLNGQSNLVQVNLGGSQIDNRYHSFFNASQGEPRRATNNIKLALDLSFDDSYMIAATISMAQNYESLRTLPRAIENGRFEVTISPREKRGQASLVGTVDRNRIDFSTSVAVAEDRTDAMLSLSCRGVQLRSTLNMQGRAGQYQLSAANRYRDSYSDRDDRISAQISISADNSVIEISAPIKELEDLRVPTNFRVEYTRQVSRDTQEYDIRTSAGDYNVKFTNRWSESASSMEFVSELAQNILDIEDITFRQQIVGRDTVSSLTTTVVYGPINAELTITKTRGGYRIEFSSTSPENTWNSDLEFSATGVTMRLDNNMFLEVPPSMYFSLSFDESVTLRADFAGENIVTLNALSDRVEFVFNFDFISIRMDAPLQPDRAEAHITINNDLHLDGSVDWSNALQVKASLKGEFEYGQVYRFSESLSLTSSVNGNNILARFQVDTALVSCDLTATINTVENDYNLSLDMAESEFVVEVSGSKLMFSRKDAARIAQVYGMDLNERSKALVYAGSADKVYVITITQPEEDTYKFNVAEKNGALTIDIVQLDAVTKLSPNLDLKVEFSIKNIIGAFLKVSHDPESNDVRFMYKYFGFYSSSVGSLNLTLDTQNPAGALAFSVDGRDLLTTSFKFTTTQSGYALDGQFKTMNMWRDPIAFGISNAFSSTPKAVSTSGSVQLMNFPVTSYDATFSQDVAASRYNYSLVANLNNGGLSQFLNFRTLSLAGWQQSENSGRRMFPSCSYTVVVDDEEYHLSFDSQIQSSAKTSRFDIDIHARHPHDVELFGLPIPKRNDIGFNLLNRKKGVRFTASYNSEFLTSPIKLVKSWRIGKDGSVDGSLVINYEANGDSIFEVAYSWAPIAQTAGHLITFNVQHPYSSTSFETSLQVIRSASETGFEASLVNMKPTGSESWLLRMVCDHNDQVFIIRAVQPGMEAVSLRFDYNSLIQQATGHIQEIIAQSTIDTRVVKGIDEVEGGYDLFIGLEVGEGQTYTIHLRATAEERTADLELYVRNTAAVVTNIANLKFTLVDSRFLKFQLSANPMLASAIEDILLIVESGFNHKTDSVVSNVYNLLNTLTTSVTGNKQVEDILGQVIKTIATYVETARAESQAFVSDSIISVTGLLENGELKIQEHTKAGIVNVMQVLADSNKILLQPFDAVMDHFFGEIISEVNTILSSVLAPVKNALDVINAGDLFMEALEDAITQVTEYVRLNGDELFFAIRGPMGNLVVVTDDEITITIPLSFLLEDVNFTALPTTDAVEAWFAKTSFSEHMRNMIPQVYAYVDHFYPVKAFLNTPLSEQVPPFKGHAFVSDFKSFRTFDGHHFDFDSNCESSHILATDGSSGNFTIIMNYGPTPSFDIRVGSEDVIITADEHVVFNQNNAILPIITASGLTVNRVGDSIKLVYNDDITIDFDTKTKLFAVEINPFYFAVTGGLFGVYDNEPNFDYVTPTGDRVDNVLDFVKSWEVSSSLCARRNQISHVEEAPSKCDALFSSNSSPFRACFPVVPQQAFTEMCSLDQADYCKIAKSYQYTCKLVGVSVAMPEDCMQCHDASGQPFNVGESRSVDTDSVDVVMVFQETSCLRTRSKPLGKFLRKFLKQTTSSFRSIQLPDTKFYVVGYGGPGANSEPHSFTMRGKTSSSRKSDVAKVIRKIDLSPEGTPSDAISAIDFASQLSFRSGAQQVIIHISCDECSENSMISQVQRNLQDRNIAFHHMPIKSIDSDSDKHVYGFSANQAFVKKAKNFDRSLINESSTDQCLPLALNSRGSVWNGIDMKSGELVNVFTDYLTVNVTPGGSRTCSCEVNEMGATATRCITAN